MVSVPEVQGPGVFVAEVPQQAQQGHRILSAGDRQHQARSLRQQQRIFQQLSVQPVMPCAPVGVRGHNRGSPVAILARVLTAPVGDFGSCCFRHVPSSTAARRPAAQP